MAFSPHFFFFHSTHSVSCQVPLILPQFHSFCHFHVPLFLSFFTQGLSLWYSVVVVCQPATLPSLLITVSQTDLSRTHWDTMLCPLLRTGQCDPQLQMKPSLLSLAVKAFQSVLNLLLHSLCLPLPTPWSPCPARSLLPHPCFYLSLCLSNGSHHSPFSHCWLCPCQNQRPLTWTLALWRPITFCPELLTWSMFYFSFLVFFRTLNNGWGRIGIILHSCNGTGEVEKGWSGNICLSGF